MKRAKTKTRHLSLILDLGAGKKSAKIALPPESCSFPTIPIFHSLSRSCFLDVTLGGAWRDIQKTKKQLRGRLHLSVLSSSFAPRKSHFFAAVTPQFFATFAFLFCSYVHLRAFLEFVHGASLLHARPRELAFLYCNNTMTAGLFSYRVLLSDLGKRWRRTSAGSHFGRF